MFPIHDPSACNNVVRSTLLKKFTHTSAGYPSIFPPAVDPIRGTFDEVPVVRTDFEATKVILNGNLDGLLIRIFAFP